MDSAIERFEHTPPKWQPLLQQLKDMSESQLRDYLAQRLQFTADNLMEMAMVVREFDQRGIDLSDLRLSLLVYLRRISPATGGCIHPSTLSARIPAADPSVCSASSTFHRRSTWPGRPTIWR